MTLFDISFSLAVFLFVILQYIWLAYNSFIRKQNKVQEDFSDVDIQLKRRAGLIDNLVEIVKSYAKHEKEVFTKVAEARSMFQKSDSVKDFSQAEALYTYAFSGILGVVENYPKLKADESYKQLMDNLKETEDRIAVYREIFNTSVRKYNVAIQMFPGSLVASLFGFVKADFFEFEVAAEPHA